MRRKRARCGRPLYIWTILALLTVLAVAGLGRGARAEAVEAVEAVDGDGEREALAKREVIGWSWWSFVQAARKGKGGKGKAKNQRIGFNGRCPWNLAGSSYLCPLVNAPSSEPQLGSADGKWAFVFADGRPRLINYSPITGWSTKWVSPVTVPLPTGCPKFTLDFTSTGDISLYCLGILRGKILINNSGRRPKRLWIDAQGIVRFVGANDATILTLTPASGPIPSSGFSVVTYATKTTDGTVPAPPGPNPGPLVPPPLQFNPPTSTPTKTLTRTKTATPAIPMITPKLDSRNMLLKSTCRYIPVPYPAARDPRTSFNIDLVSCGSNPSIDAVFVKAAQKWMDLITGDLTDFDSEPADAVDCLQDFGSRPIMRCGYVDDIAIAFSVLPIDGVGKILGSAGPVFSRTKDWPAGRMLPISGWMQFDIADFSSLTLKGLIEDVVTHEMAHVLGFGTRWPALSLITPVNCDKVADIGPVPNPRFTGSLASRSLVKIGYPGAQPPVESKGGTGTACTHWSESALGRELMTGYLAAQGGNPLSIVTAAAMDDLGYEIDYGSKVIEKFDSRGSHYHARKTGGGLKMPGCLKGWKQKGVIGYNMTRAGRK